PVRQQPVALRKDRDQVRRGLKKWLVFIRPERRERVEPLPRRAVVVKLVFFFFRALTNLTFDRRIADDDKMPGLEIRPARRAARNHQAVFDDFTRHRSISKVTHRPPPEHLLAKS